MTAHSSLATHEETQTPNCKIIQLPYNMAATALKNYQVEEPGNQYQPKQAAQPDQLNYIQLINRFWQMHEEHCFTGNEIALYFYLLKSCNSLGWKQSFRHSNGYISGALAISEKTLINSRNKLKQAGLIEFNSGAGRRAMSDYTINTGNSTAFRGVFRADLGGHFGQVSGTNPSDNTKLNKNKTKKDNKPPKSHSEIVAEQLVKLSEDNQAVWRRFLKWFDEQEFEVLSKKEQITPNQLIKLAETFSPAEIKSTLIAMDPWPGLKVRDAIHGTLRAWLTKNAKID